jgi:hypothetical protein
MSSYKTNNTPEYLAKLRESVGRSARLAKSILETQLQYQHDFDNPKMDDSIQTEIPAKKETKKMPGNESENESDNDKNKFEANFLELEKEVEKLKILNDKNQGKNK